MKIQKDSLISFFIGVFLGFIIWTLSPIFTDKTEPWDAEGRYYPISLFVAGIIGYSLYPKRLFANVIGIYIGQVLYLFIFVSGPLWIVGVILIGVYSSVAFIGGWMVWYLRKKKLGKGQF